MKKLRQIDKDYLCSKGYQPLNGSDILTKKFDSIIFTDKITGAIDIIAVTIFLKMKESNWYVYKAVTIENNIEKNVFELFFVTGTMQELALFEILQVGT